MASNLFFSSSALFSADVARVTYSACASRFDMRWRAFDTLTRWYSMKATGFRASSRSSGNMTSISWNWARTEPALATKLSMGISRRRWISARTFRISTGRKKSGLAACTDTTAVSAVGAVTCSKGNTVMSRWL